MVARALGDRVLPATLTGGSGFDESVARDTRQAAIYVKLVNSQASAQTIDITLNGLSKIDPNGAATTLRGAALHDTNTLSNPSNIVPVGSTFAVCAAGFDYTVSPLSVTVLTVKAR